MSLTPATRRDWSETSKSLFYLLREPCRAAGLAKILYSRVLKGKELSRGGNTVIPHSTYQAGGVTAITVQASKQRVRVSTPKSPGTLRNSKSSAKQTASKGGDCAREIGSPAWA